MSTTPRRPASHGEPTARSRPEGVDRLATALQDPTRRRILLDLVSHGESRTIDDVARLVRVHRTVVFTHLERLTDLGYLEKTQRRGRLGKPASLYSAKPSVLSMTYPARQFVALATILAAWFADLGPDARGAAKAAGRSFGEDVAASPQVRSVAEALSALDALGADYTMQGDQILAGNCVFLEACRDAREVVCNVQAGILEGALCRGGIAATIEPRGPIPGNGCSYQLTLTEATT